MPPPLTIGSSQNSLIAATIARAPLGQLLRRALLHEADRRAAQAPPGRLVADAGDLALVGHQRVEFDLRPAFDLPRQRHRLLDRVDRRALRPDLDPPAERPPAGVDVDADADRRRVGAEHGLDRLQVLDAVDHHQRRAVPGRRPSAAPAPAAPRSRRSGRRAAGPRARVRRATASRAACRSSARRSARRGRGSPRSAPGSGSTSSPPGSACAPPDPAARPRSPTSRRGRQRRTAPRPRQRSARSAHATAGAARTPAPAYPCAARDSAWSAISTYNPSGGTANRPRCPERWPSG